MTNYTFTRYLASKISVDDRALNRPVWAALAKAVAAGHPEGAWRVLEVGAGLGSMAERMAERGLLAKAHYTLVDEQPDNIAEAERRLKRLPPDWTVELHAADMFAFLRDQAGRQWDLLVAHAVLDLLSLPADLTTLLSALRPGGLAYFTINFDGATVFQPEIEPEFDALIERLYHRNMDERLTAGRPSGDSRTGRHLFGWLKQANLSILAAGPSDWVVFPGPGGYPADEAYFLHFIVHTLDGALRGHPELDPMRFAAWIAERHAQIERGELAYIAHQLDFLARQAYKETGLGPIPFK